MMEDVLVNLTTILTILTLMCSFLAWRVAKMTKRGEYITTLAAHLQPLLLRRKYIKREINTTEMKYSTIVEIMTWILEEEDEIEDKKKSKKIKYKIERFFGGNLKGRVRLDLRVRVKPKPPEHVIKGIKEKLAEIMEVRWSKNWNNEYWIGVSYDKIKIDRPDITAYEIIGKWALMLDAIETIIKEYESGTNNLAKLGEK